MMRSQSSMTPGQQPSQGGMGGGIFGQQSRIGLLDATGSGQQGPQPIQGNAPYSPTSTPDWAQKLPGAITNSDQLQNYGINGNWLDQYQNLGGYGNQPKFGGSFFNMPMPGYQQGNFGGFQNSFGNFDVINGLCLFDFF